MRLEIFQKLLVGQNGFRLSLSKGRQVLLVFAKSQTHRVVDKVRDCALGMGRLYSKGSMKVRTEIDCGTFG